jgi:hypothetical protein
MLWDAQQQQQQGQPDLASQVLSPPPPTQPTDVNGFLLNAGNAGRLATQQPQNLGAMALSGPQSVPGPTFGQPGHNDTPSTPGALPVKKPGAFSQGGTGWKIVGLIGDALQTAGGGKATYAEGIQKQHEDELARENAVRDAILRRQIELQYPTVPAEQQNWAAYLGLDEKTRAMVDRYRTEGAPHFGIDPATGAPGFYTPPQPYTGAGSGAAAPTPPAVGETYTDEDTGIVYRRTKPGLGRDSWQAIGGPGQGGPATFPGAR